jgi:hypothetical protein
MAALVLAWPLSRMNRLLHRRSYPRKKKKKPLEPSPLLHTAITLLDLAESAAKAIPILGNSLEGAFASGRKIISLLEVRLNQS